MLALHMLWFLCPFLLLRLSKTLPNSNVLREHSLILCEITCETYERAFTLTWIRKTRRVRKLRYTWKPTQLSQTVGKWRVSNKSQLYTTITIKYRDQRIVRWKGRIFVCKAYQLSRSCWQRASLRRAVAASCSTIVRPEMTWRQMGRSFVSLFWSSLKAYQLTYLDTGALGMRGFRACMVFLSATGFIKYQHQ